VTTTFEVSALYAKVAVKNKSLGDALIQSFYEAAEVWGRVFKNWEKASKEKIIELFFYM
jgi:hypothetical protein